MWTRQQLACPPANLLHSACTYACDMWQRIMQLAVTRRRHATPILHTRGVVSQCLILVLNAMGPPAPSTTTPAYHVLAYVMRRPLIMTKLRLSIIAPCAATMRQVSTCRTRCHKTEESEYPNHAKRHVCSFNWYREVCHANAQRTP